MKFMNTIRRNKQKMVWLLPLLIFFAGLIPGVVDSFLWKALGAFLFLAVIGIAGYGLMGGYEREPKKLRKKAPAAAAANQ
ncbi:hypothetical protein P4H32_26390 [Bacillus cereus]|nr:hypothetical protein [Bacillus cereus]